MSQQRYPLAWPPAWRRTSPNYRQRARFEQRTTQYGQGGSSWKARKELSVAAALNRLMVELERLNARQVILSTNLLLRQDGMPRSDQREPQDPGVAVYFQLDRKPRVLACDRWLRVADNIAAVAAHIFSIRAVDRYGVGTLEQAFAGYAALPAKEEWWSILGLGPEATLDQAEEAFRKLARIHHPDAGGSHDLMSRLTEARETARQLLGGGR